MFIDMALVLKQKAFGPVLKRVWHWLYSIQLQHVLQNQCHINENAENFVMYYKPNAISTEIRFLFKTTNGITGKARTPLSNT